jgi:hypothetical protein
MSPVKLLPSAPEDDVFDPLMTLLVAKAKAVGLVAGTALATTALVGGGAVAFTAVSAETDLEPDAAVVETVEAVEGVETVSATPTVGIEEPEAPEAPPARKPLPADFTCDETQNHGQNVSAYARSLPKGPGRGEKISAVAQSDCGKSAGTEVEPAEVETAAVEEAEEPRPAKAAKPAKAQKPAKPAKAEKAPKPAKAERAAKAEKPAKAQSKGKPAGKGNGKG